MSEYAIDVVFCVDVSGDMNVALETVRKAIAGFPETVAAHFKNNDRSVGNLRVKLIPFRDLNYDRNAITETEFFTLPDEQEKYLEALAGLEAIGGGDEPESGLDALALAMKSDWCITEGPQRHIIVVMTSASAHPLEDGQEHLPGVPENLEELRKWWEEGLPEFGSDFYARRMIIFAPNSYPWYIIADWDNVSVVYPDTDSGIDLYSRIYP